MKKLILGAALTVAVGAQAQEAHLRVNNIGYLPEHFKAAVYMGDKPAQELSFELKNARGQIMRFDSVRTAPAWAPMKAAARIYFSSVSTPGAYTLAVKDKKSKRTLSSTALYIGKDAYRRFQLNESLLNYLRQQRCGYNPAHKEECHTRDGILVLAGDATGDTVNVYGGWHDASDYLQYLPTSANTVYHLLFGYRENPSAWADNFDAMGHDNPNGIPDILDEARWGLEWMLRMNPRKELYLNQIADDRDHRYVGVPSKDNVDYGWGKGDARPVYPVSGQPQGLQKYSNRSNGEASSVAKFASSFALGAQVFTAIDSSFARQLAQRSEEAFDYALAHPGAAQTAPCSSPYFYEEENWVDDMELAAAIRATLTGNKQYSQLARAYGSAERVTPWMGTDTARHYQWYPFFNLGHFEARFPEYYSEGLARVEKRARGNAFHIGVPFVWCSNNFVAALATQAMLYREMSSDTQFAEQEAAARDWLFGLNPWGQTMIILPEDITENSPHDPHSAMTDLTVDNRPGIEFLYGGLVDGPVYSNIFKSLWGVHLRRPDRFAALQGPIAVYHDDWSDYSTNEPTMDGTASLAFLLGRLCGR